MITFLFAAFFLPAVGKPLSFQWGEYEQKALNPGSVKLLVWNMAKGWGFSWRREFAKLSADKDLVLLQEMVASKEEGLPFVLQPGFGLHMGVSFFYDLKEEMTGVALLSRAEPVEFNFLRTEDLEFGLFTPKTSSFARFALEGREDTLLVINVHALLMVRFSKYKEQLRAMTSLIRTHPGPVIFAGDFNTWTRNRLNFLKDFSASLGLSEVVFENGWQKTHSFMTDFPLDHVFVRGLRVNRARVVLARNSDHNALRLELNADL